MHPTAIHLGISGPVRLSLSVAGKICKAVNFIECINLWDISFIMPVPFPYNFITFPFRRFLSFTQRTSFVRQYFILPHSLQLSKANMQSNLPNRLFLTEHFTVILDNFQFIYQLK